MRKENNSNNGIQNDKPTKNTNAEDRNTTKKIFILFNVKQYGGN